MLEREAFDAVVCSSVLEYVPDDTRLLRAFFDALRPGGGLVISVPHTGSLIGGLESAAQRLRIGMGRVGRGHLAYSLRRYRRSVFLRTLADVGFEDLATRYFETPRLGELGTWLSRFRWFGVMMLVTARRPGPAPERKPA
jgi:SAM-dependent methyltransferase